MVTLQCNQIMEIGALVSNQNPQWTDGNYIPKESGWPKREVFTAVEEWLGKRFVLALTGVRRVGKSTLIKQIISRLILKKQGQRVVYFSFEKVHLKREPLLLQRIIMYYLEDVLGEKIYELKNRVYFFFDEVQNIPNWQEIVKYFYDQNDNFKFIVSGSSSLFVSKVSRESLAGRMIEIKVNPLSFKEYLTLVHPDFRLQPKNKTWITANIGVLNNYFEKYLRMGQFPEIITEGMNSQQAGEYLETIEEKITQQDLPKMFPIKHPEILSLILSQIRAGPGQRIEYGEFAQNAGVDQRTMAKYFDFLQKGFLLFLCGNFGKKPLKSLRVARKAYLVSSNFGDQTALPALVENYIFNFFYNRGFLVYFQKEKEIDFVVWDKRKRLILAEVKYQNEIKKEDMINLKDFLSRGPATAYLYTKKFFKLERPINFIPACLTEFYL